LVDDDKCQRNKGLCQAPGQGCGGVWCEGTNTDCESNVFGFLLVLTDVDTSSASYESTLIAAIAEALGTSEDCVDLDTAISTTRRLTSSTVQQPGTAGVNAATTSADVTAALNSPSFTSSVCGSVGGPSCTVTAAASTTVTTTTTTTSEMPWGLPWWAWFLICCGILLLCALCFLPVCGAPLMGGKKKSKAPATTETVYEVVDEPDTVTDAVPMATSVIPMATSAYPVATATPMATAGYPMATAAYPMTTY